MAGEKSFSSSLKSSPSIVAHSLSIKLDDSNFLLWKWQVGVAIQGHKLQKFILENENPPERFLTTGDRVQGFHNTKKDDLSVNDYLLKIKSLIAQLASVGYVVTTKDHIDAIFDGLSFEYDTFVVTVNSRNDLYTVAEIESLLLAQENRMEKHSKELDLANQVNMNATPQMSAQMAAMVVNPNVVIDNSWYPDSGSTNHCTPDPNNLIIQDIYAKNDQIHMGDGTNLAINTLGKVANGLYVFDSSSIQLKSQSLKSSSAYHVPCFPINPKCMSVQATTIASNASIDPIFQFWHNRDVQFNEKSFPFAKTKSITSSSSIPSPTPTSHSALIPIHSSILSVPSLSTSSITNTVADQSNSDQTNAKHVSNVSRNVHFHENQI
ncbi:hypothetical protein CK203_117294 [Vitis vinifera]|uniref:Retrovirus-related Pol polyprotein from transposon RE1 n=1 Tax=Vitis vinifera TaxID=29760 RepID=A0A438DKP7_VITVI|nr:hypothetical protein CK203_117294 [Vitis vinifera]